MHRLAVVGENYVDFVADVLRVDGWPFGKAPGVAKVRQLLADAGEGGDLRRVLDSGADVRTISVGKVMTAGGKRIAGSALAAEAVQKMEAGKITALMVCDDRGQLVGVIHLQDLLRAGVV